MVISPNNNSEPVVTNSLTYAITRLIDPFGYEIVSKALGNADGNHIAWLHALGIFQIGQAIDIGSLDFNAPDGLTDTLFFFYFFDEHRMDRAFQFLVADFRYLGLDGHELVIPFSLTSSGI